MKKDTEKTLVIFRKVVKSGEVFALFPYELGNYDAWTCSCYQHIGQHGTADVQLCVGITSPAKPGDYAPLKRELEGLGYNLKIGKRFPSGAQDVRRQALQVRS